MIKLNREFFLHFVKYSFVGILNAIFSFMLYFILLKIVHLQYLAAFSVSWLLGVLLTYVINFLWVFKPEQKLVFKKDAKTVDVERYNKKRDMSWRDGILTFYDEKLIDIAKKLERFYDVTIVFENKEIEDYRYTGEFDEETIKEALDVIRIITPFDYKKKDRVITIKKM